MPADILLYAIIAIGLVFWLRSILGTTHGDEPNQTNFRVPPEQQNNSSSNDAFAGAPASNPYTAAVTEANLSDGLERNMSLNDGALSGLGQIRDKDRTFDIPFFMKAAQDAFVFIVEAYSQGDRETLKNLLSENVYAGFASALDDREKKKYTSELEIHAVRKIEAQDAWVKDKMAYVTIRFVADETRVLRDESDQIIQGNPDRVSETIDIWTFGREIKSRNPAWVVYETRDEDAADSEHKTVPDTDETLDSKD